MNKNKKNKPFTKEDFGLALHKYIIPIYEEVKKNSQEIKGIKSHLTGITGEFESIKNEFTSLKDDIDEVTRIQLRMENKIDDQIKLLHDRDDIHDKKIKDHEKRITVLEKPRRLDM